MPQLAQGNRILLSESEYRSQILQIPARPLRFASTPIFSDFSPFAKFSAGRRSVDMFSAACLILITLPSSPNGARASGEDRSQIPNAPSQPPESDPPEPAGLL